MISITIYVIGGFMSFLKLAQRRTSVRKFKPILIKREHLYEILEAGRVAPTMGNCQCQRIYVIESPEKLKKLSMAGQTYGASTVLVVCADKKVSYKRPFDNYDSAIVDTAVVTTHMMLAATDLDLGSVWISNFYPIMTKKILNLPENIDPMCLLAIGIPDQLLKDSNRHNKERLPLIKTVNFDKY
jgi:nitroreductase